MSQGRGAPKGNRNAAKAKIWSAAIERALARRSSVDGRIMLDALAEKLIALAEAGDLAALREIGDRLEGRPAQALALEGSLEEQQPTGCAPFLPGLKAEVSRSKI